MLIRERIFPVSKLEILSMNKILFCRKYFLFFLIINSLNNSILGEERSCIDYPYPNGIYLKDNLVLNFLYIYVLFAINFIL